MERDAQLPSPPSPQYSPSICLRITFSGSTIYLAFEELLLTLPVKGEDEIKAAFQKAAFEELLLTLPVKGEDEIKAAFQKAVIARLKARFLLADQNTQAY